MESPSDSRSAPGSSWGRLGVVLGALGPLLGPPGPLLGVILASQKAPKSDPWEVFLEAWPRAFKNQVFRRFYCFFGVLFGSSFWSSLALLAATPAAKRTLKNHEKPLVFSMNLLGCPFLRQVQREHISEHRRTKNREKNKSRNSPRDARKNASTFIDFEPKWLQNRASIAPGGAFGASWRLLWLSDGILEASCALLAAPERLFEPPESAKSDFRQLLRAQEQRVATDG